MKLRLPTAVTTAWVLLAACCLPASAQPDALHTVAPADTGSDSRHWGELVEGLQMHAALDMESLTVTCIIRNGCTEVVGYSEYMLGHCVSSWLERECDTGWQPIVQWLHVSIGVAPRPKENRIAQPGALLPMPEWSGCESAQDTFVVSLNWFDWPEGIAQEPTLGIRVVHGVFSAVDVSPGNDDRWHYMVIRSAPIRIDDPAVIRKLVSR